MKRDVALMLMGICRQHQGREYNAWHCAKGDKEAEKHRLACADWARAGQQLYDLIERTNTYGIRLSSQAAPAHRTASQSLSGVQHEGEPDQAAPISE